MSVRGRREEPDLREALERCLDLASAWKGELYRAVSPRYAARERLVDGRGSAKHGGRWNLPGARTVYGSTTPECALAESLAAARRLGIPDASQLPKVVAAFAARLDTVLDLTDARVAKRLGLRATSLVRDDWQQALGGRHADASQALGGACASQALGTAARGIGLQGLLVPSGAQPGGRNVVIFLEHCGRRSLRAATRRSSRRPKSAGRRPRR
jgi:RES domain-containing protein